MGASHLPTVLFGNCSLFAIVCIQLMIYSMHTFIHRCVVIYIFKHFQELYYEEQICIKNQCEQDFLVNRAGCVYIITVSVVTVIFFVVFCCFCFCIL